MQAETVGNLHIVGPVASGLAPLQASSLSAVQAGGGIDINRITNLMLTVMVMAMGMRMMERL